MDDLELLREYAARKSELAFETLVARYINVVYSAALRQAGDPHLAQEITQAVFIILARKAGGMGRGTLLLGWLVRTVRFTASAQIRAAVRRRRREQEAQMECSTLETFPDSTWELMSPLLDEALASLNAPDRQAVLLRYLEQKSLAEVGASLAINEEAARKRVMRALEKLRRFFTKHGVVLTAAVIGGAMSSHAVQAAPAGLAKAVAGAALAHTAAGGSTLTLVKGALKLMAWTKAKMAVAASVGLLLAAGTTTVVVNYTKIRPSESIYETIFKDPQNNVAALATAPPTLILRPTRYPKRSGRVHTNTGLDVVVDGTIADLIHWAYGFDEARMVFPDGMPEGHYDYLSTLPGGMRQDMEDLQAELTRQFGVVAHSDTRETDVLLLQIKDADKLKAHLTKGGRQSIAYGAANNNVQKWSFTNQVVLALVGDLQALWKKPVVDRTGSQRGQRRSGTALGMEVPEIGSQNSYDFYVEWKEQRWSSETARTESLRQAWAAALDNFGLELVPSRESVPMLVVERVRK